MKAHLMPNPIERLSHNIIRSELLFSRTTPASVGGVCIYLANTLYFCQATLSRIAEVVVPQQTRVEKLI